MRQPAPTDHRRSPARLPIECCVVPLRQYAPLRGHPV